LEATELAAFMTTKEIVLLQPKSLDDLV